MPPFLVICGPQDSTEPDNNSVYMHGKIDVCTGMKTSNFDIATLFFWLEEEGGGHALKIDQFCST